MSFDWKHLTIVAIASAIITALCLNSCGDSRPYSPQEDKFQTTEIKAVTHDTVYVHDKVTEYATKYVHTTETDTIRDTAFIVIDFLDSTREYFRTYEYPNACIDVHSKIMFNTLASQDVQFTPMFVNHEQNKSLDRLFGGLLYSSHPSTIDLTLEYRLNQFSIIGSRSLNVDCWRAGILYGLK